MSDIPPDYLDLLRNFAATKWCAPLVYKSIITWGWDKDPAESILNYIERKNLLTNIFNKPKAIEDWKLKNKRKLDQTKLDGFDITFLHDLLPVVCFNKISKPGSKEYTEKQNESSFPSTVEFFLKEIKDKRNDICHEETVPSDFMATLQDLQDSCIEAAGILYNKNNTEIKREKKILTDKLKNIVEDTTSTAEKRIKMVKDLILTKSIAELETTAREFVTFQPLPGCPTSTIDIRENFYSLNLARLKIVNGNKEQKESFLFSKLLEDESEKYVVISGDPGAGKTISMRSLFVRKLEEYQQFLSDESRVCPLPIYLECRTEQSDNFEQFLKSLIPSHLTGFQSNEISQAIQQLDEIIFLVDGYDEVNDNSKQLVNHIINFCQKKRKRMCVISSRRKAAYDIEYKLSNSAIRFDHFSIEPILDLKDKIEFFRSYSKDLNPEKSEEIIQFFRNMNKRAQDVFSSPILLSLFYFMYFDGFYDSVAVSNDVEVNEKIYQYFKRKIEIKIESSDASFAANKILEVMNKHCLELFKKRKYYLLQEDFEKLGLECTRICPDVKNMETILDCFLSPVFSLKENRNTRQFIHTTIQEHCAAKKLVLELENRLSTSIEDNDSNIISEALGFTKDTPMLFSEVDRCENIVRSGILLLFLKKKLTDHAESFKDFMRSFIRRNERFWFDLLSASDCDETISEIAVMALNQRQWKILKCDHFKAASKLVSKLLAPSEINIIIDNPINADERNNLVQLLKNLKLHHKGSLSLDFSYSHNNFEPLDDVFEELRGSRNKITSITACVTSETTLTILRSLKSTQEKKGPLMMISFPVVDAPNMSILEGGSTSNVSEEASTSNVSGEDSDVKVDDSHSMLYFTVKLSSSLPRTRNNPLPNNAGLTIPDVPCTRYEDTLKAIRYLAPSNKTFSHLNLQGCALSDSEVLRMSLLLHGEGFKLQVHAGSGVIKETRGHAPSYMLLQDRQELFSFQCYLGTSPDDASATPHESSRSVASPPRTSSLQQRARDGKCCCQ